MINKILILIAFLFWIRRFIFQNNTFLHILQLEGYRNKRLIRWIIKHPKKGFDEEAFITGSGLLLIGLFLENFRVAIIFPILWMLVGVWLFTKCKRKKQKRLLVWTPRAKRLGFLSIFISLFLLGTIFSHPSSLIFFLIAQIILQLAPFNLILTNILLFPLETSINLYYLTRARRKIRRIRPKVIGIAGSYGKTSVKYIIGGILSKTYNTLITPKSYNTLMGVCKVINNELKKEHQVFVVEMGAYKIGDIKKLCRLVNPEIGVLTGIGPQHLERFKTMENIIKAKFEIIESLPSFGVAIVNNEDETCRKLMDKIKIKRIGYGISQDSGVEEEMIMAEDVEVDASGIRFTFRGTNFKTRLLGRHNVLNVLAGIAVSLELKIEIEKIKTSIEELSYIPHRLQLIKNPNNVFVLDDSYNSNPMGAEEALFSLSLFENRRKILVSPGMIELGSIEYEENKKFGKKAAKTCDMVILVGQRGAEPIFKGLKEEGFLEKHIILVDNFERAKEELERIVKPNDIVLFENDLPDTYEL